MLRRLKRAALQAARAGGVDSILLASSWRARRLLILGYHGISQRDEHEWDPGLYMSPKQFARRLDLLKQHRCAVLPLGEALERAAQGTLPPRAVALTFDDGMVDFYREAAPLLQAAGFPATVYLTSFYAAWNRPIFYLACSYLLWKHPCAVLPPLGFLNGAQPADHTAARTFIGNWVDTARPSAEAQQAALEELAVHLGTSTADLTRDRILHVMNPEEVGAVGRLGFSVELHTHRHRTPVDAALFAREVEDNRARIEQWTGRTPTHFCYPNGTVHPPFPGWLRQQKVRSAVTCQPALTGAMTDHMLLPRLIDTSPLSEIEFSGWLSGTGHLLRALALTFRAK